MELKDIRNKINLIDKDMAKLFEERMNLAYEVAQYKIKNGLAIEDKVRENQLIKQNVEYIQNDEIKEYYIDFLKDLMNTSTAKAIAKEREEYMKDYIARFNAEWRGEK